MADETSDVASGETASVVAGVVLCVVVWCVARETSGVVAGVVV